VICSVAGRPIPHPLPTKNRTKLYEKLLKDLAVREAKLTSDGLHRKLPIDENDIAYIFEDLHRGRSTVPPHPVLAKPSLVRWDINRALSIQNCVVLSPSEIRQIEAAGGIGERVVLWNSDKGEEAVSGSAVSRVVSKRLQEARQHASVI